MRYVNTGALAALALASLACQQGVALGQTSPDSSRANWFSRLFESPSWEEAIADVDSPKRAARLVRLHIRFREDISDEWADGRTSWERGFGDCEDFAAAVVDLCRAAGLAGSARIYVFRATGSEGHAAAVGYWDDRMWIASNGWFEYVVSMAEAADLIATEMGWQDRSVDYTTLDGMRESRSAVGKAGSADAR